MEFHGSMTHSTMHGWNSHTSDNLLVWQQLVIIRVSLHVFSCSSMGPGRPVKKNHVWDAKHSGRTRAMNKTDLFKSRTRKLEMNIKRYYMC